MNGDKKKMLVLGVLALLLVAVGAFSFLSGGSSGESAELTTTKADETANATENADGTPIEGDATLEEGKNVDGTPQEGMLAMLPLAPRDPFTIPDQLDDKPKPEPAKPVEQTPVQQAPRPLTSNRPGGNQPFDIDMGALPGGSGGGIGSGVPMAVVPQYAVKGIILGSKPLAVFEDGSGNQKLVPLGGSIDGDTKVVAIEKGKVTVSYKGKHQTLVIDEEARND
jgi:hypothetical protein